MSPEEFINHAFHLPDLSRHEESIVNQWKIALNDQVEKVEEFFDRKVDFPHAKVFSNYILILV
jgi:hypothetical protein